MSAYYTFNPVPTLCVLCPLMVYSSQKMNKNQTIPTTVGSSGKCHMATWKYRSSGYLTLLTSNRGCVLPAPPLPLDKAIRTDALFHGQHPVIE